MKENLIKDIEELTEKLKEVSKKLSYVDYDEKLFKRHKLLVIVIEHLLYELEEIDVDKFIELQEKIVDFV